MKYECLLKNIIFIFYARQKKLPIDISSIAINIRIHYHNGEEGQPRDSSLFFRGLRRH